MKAIVVDKPFEMRITDVNMPRIKDDEVLIKVISGGICGSDIAIYNGTNSLATYPRLIGHEIGGKVVKTGKDVTSMKLNDIVAVDPVRACGHCYACRIGRHNVCATLEVMGVHRDGGFAEYVAAPAKFVYPLDTSKVDARFACLVEPYSVGVQVNYRGNVVKGDKMLIMGSGPVGICIMQVAESRGASVMMTDIFDERLARAKDMGADFTVNVKKETLLDCVMEWTNKEGAMIIADTVCSTASFSEALSLACPAGRVVILGLIDKPSKVAQVTITKKELDVKGSRLNNYRFPEVIEGFESGALTPHKLCSHIIPFTDVEKAFRLIKEHPEQVCKIVMEF